MKKRVWFIIFGVCLLGLAAWFGFNFTKHIGQPTLSTPLALGSEDRILILAPHPDDEVLGCGGVIQEAVKRKIPVRIVFFTYGDNAQWSFFLYRKHPVILPRAARKMGLVRHDEAMAVDKMLGIPPEEITFLGYPDFRTIHIWYSHWKDQPPAKSMLTRVKAVPYANAFRPGAPYKGEEILRDLKEIILEFKPTRVFLPHPADHSPDHKALYLFTRLGLWDIENQIKPILYPYLVHYKRWPNPKGYQPERKLVPPANLNQGIAWQTYNLNPGEITKKYSAVKKYHTQYNTSRSYLLSFIGSNELFGDFPAISLKPETYNFFLSSRKKEEVPEPPEELTDEERAVFLGIEEQMVSLQGKNLVVSLKLSRPVVGTVGLSVYLFGYRKDKPFPDMPKLHVAFGAVEHRIFDQTKRLPLNTVLVKRDSKNIFLTVPLEVLGNPSLVLANAQTYLGEVPLDQAPWRVIEIGK
ncbi:MAG: PIG-L family deacetylase [Candidatus Omnitrophota bacterium]